MTPADRSRGPELAEAVQSEIERLGLADQFGAAYVPERNTIRITHLARSGAARSIDYPVGVASIHPILDFLRVEARLASVRRAREIAAAAGGGSTS